MEDCSRQAPWSNNVWSSASCTPARSGYSLVAARPRVVHPPPYTLAGAEVDSTANVYGGGCTTLGLAATSEYPERAGVQEALLQTLLDHGARLEQASIAGSKQSMVIACVANGRLKAAEFLVSC